MSANPPVGFGVVYVVFTNAFIFLEPLELGGSDETWREFGQAQASRLSILVSLIFEFSELFHVLRILGI